LELRINQLTSFFEKYPEETKELKNQFFGKKEGDLIIRKEYTETLIKLSKDINSFYNGEIAQTLVNEIQQAGGIINLSDFAKYSVKISINL
jgi:gamma-glutamyltranspeptidase